MEILAHGSGLEFRVNIHFTVFALPGIYRYLSVGYEI
jgi:hypothetical protein